VSPGTTRSIKDALLKIEPSCGCTMQFWDLFQWWNLIFTLPFGIGLLPLLLQAMGAVHLGHGAQLPHVGGHHLPHVGGHQLPHVGHAHVAAHGHAPAAAHGQAASAAPAAHGPAHAPAKAGTHADAQETPSHLLSMLGIGKAPIMLIFSIFCLTWGASGVAGNQIFSKILRVPGLYVWPAMLCALVVSSFTTGGIAQWISRLMPDTKSYGTDEQELIGRTAQAAYELGAKPGSAFLLDDQQNRIQVRCRTHDGSTIPRGAEVLLLEYDAKSRVFTVVRFQRETPPPAGEPQQQAERPVRPQQKMRLQ
jgi:hypothetical protein